MELTDQYIIDNFRATRDAKCFQSLVTRYQNRVYNAAFRILGSDQEAEEVVQETFIKVLQNIEKFRNQASFAAWMFKIAHNICMDVLRLKHRTGGEAMSFDPQSIYEQDQVSAVPLTLVSQIADPELNPSQRVDCLEEQEIIALSLMKLSHPQRAVLVLHDIEGFSYEDIAEIIGISIGTVRSRLHYGRLKLREMLTPYFQNSPIAYYSR